MLFKVIAVYLNTGISKNSGAPFTMPRVAVLSSFRDVDSPNFQSHGFGFSAVDLSVSNNIFNDLQKHFVAQFKDGFVEMDLDTSLDGDGRIAVIGFNSSYQNTAPAPAPVQTETVETTENADRKKTVMFGGK